MRTRTAIFAVLAAAAVVAVLALVLSDKDSDSSARSALPGEPTVAVISPRNGARQRARSVVVKVKLANFRLAPRRFGGEPQLGEGHIRFALNRVPNCVDPVKLRRAEESPLGRGRLLGASFDYPEFAGPNGVLAERIGSSGDYSPSTRPEIYYSGLPAGFYRLVVTLALNNGATTPYHAVTNFEILTPPGHETKPCSGGKVSSAEAATFD
jgi:hypothetical protein